MGKLNRSVPKWADVMLGFIAGGTYASSMYETNLAGRTLLEYRLQVLGTLGASLITCLVVHWLLGWCFGLIRKVKPITLVSDHFSRRPAASHPQLTQYPRALLGSRLLGSGKTPH